MVKENLKQTAYNFIKSRILHCEYEPNAFLNEEYLCDDLSMSRTPIRDALGRLEQEGLIQIVPKKGFLVSPISFNEINMVFEGRKLLEPYVIQSCCSHIESDTLNTLKATLEAEKKSFDKDFQSIYVYDNDFHDLIMEQCKNRFLLDTYSKLRDSNTRLRIISGINARERLKSTITEHHAILNALIRHDTRAASEAMTYHIEVARKAAFHAFTN